MADNAGSILAPNVPDWTPPATTQTPVDSSAAATPTETTPPVTVNSGDPNQVSPVAMGQPMIASADQPTYNQPEMLAPHEAWWHRALNEVGTLLGGNQTITLTKTPDGTMRVDRAPSTMGEKWGRVAAAMLGGAAQGLAVGQGPGGPARAVAAGTQFGMELPQKQLAQANAEAASMNAQQLAAANSALLHQKIVTQGLQSQSAGLTLAGEQAALFNKINDVVKGSPNAQVLPTVDNMPDMAKLPLSYANALQAHANGQMVMLVQPGANGKVGFTPVIVDRAYSSRLNDKPRDVLSLGVDPTTKAPILQSKSVDPLTHTNGDIDTGNQAVIASFLTQNNAFMKADAAANKPAPGPKTIPEIELAAQQETNPVKRQQFIDTLSTDQKRELAQRAASRAQVPGLLPTGGAAASAGTTGDDYLKAAVDPSMWNQVRSIANGDVKMPTAGNRGANQALRNAVMNYDPTFTDARYTTKQNFKTSGDADSIKQLSTVLAHAERGLKNSAALGFSPSLASGKNFSGDASAYNTDVNFFTGEAGKLALGGVVGLTEADKISSQLTSPVQSIRDSALNEVLDLTSGKVGAIAQKYKTGTGGQELPVHEFFDPATQALLRRFNIVSTPAGATPPPAATTPTPTPNAASNTSQAARAPQSQNVVPPGKFAVKVGGKTVGYADDPKGTNYNAF